MLCFCFLQTIELEKKAKMHMEDSLRVAIEEKDELIKALKTQVPYCSLKSCADEEFLLNKFYFLVRAVKNRFSEAMVNHQVLVSM